jgi:Flp pilus assembly pilin Flp
MRRKGQDDDRGASLVEYALLVMFIALGSAGVAAKVGDATSDTFVEATGAFSANGLEEELTPKEKWEQAQDDYADAIADAKANKTSELAAATAQYNSAKAANSALPKAERNLANAQAKDTHNAAKAAANSKYSSSVQSAKDAQAAAKAEYNANK